jgi:hypothetical protein
VNWPSHRNICAVLRAFKANGRPFSMVIRRIRLRRA